MNVTDKTIDEYIATFDENTQQILSNIRNTIQAAAPDAKETISYGMPTFKLNGNLVHFAAYKDHIGFYPAPSGVTHLKELAKYISGKGTIKFSLDQKIPYDLIKKVVEFRVEENLLNK